MKVYLCIESDYEGSNAFRAFKDKKKADKLKTQVQRLFDVAHKIYETDRKMMEKYMEDRPEIITNTKFKLYYDSEEYKKLERFRRKVDRVIEGIGADSFYRWCEVEEKKIE